MLCSRGIRAGIEHFLLMKNLHRPRRLDHISTISPKPLKSLGLFVISTERPGIGTAAFGPLIAYSGFEESDKELVV